VHWEVHGHATLRGRQEFDAAVEYDATPGPAALLTN